MVEIVWKLAGIHTENRPMLKKKEKTRKLYGWEAEAGMLLVLKVLDHKPWIGLSSKL